MNAAELFGVEDFQELPEVIDQALVDDGLATCCALNHSGNYLGVGCHDGRVLIWYLKTLHTLRPWKRFISGHIRAVRSVNFSSCSKYLLTLSDISLVVWNISDGKILLRICLESVCISAKFCPLDWKKILVSSFMDAPSLITIKEKQKDDDSLHQNFHGILQRNLPSYAFKIASWDKLDEKFLFSGTKNSERAAKSHNVAYFDNSGDRIYVGNNKGQCLVFHTEDFPHREPFFKFTVTNFSAIRDITFSTDNNFLLLNCNDCTIRCYSTSNFILLSEMFDAVDKQSWRKCLFSKDSEFVIGGAVKKSSHNLSVWNRDNGHVYKLIEGPNEGFLDFVVHPEHPIIFSCSTHGVIYVWSAMKKEKWSAYAPNFVELEENEEYLEQEDEYDIKENPQNYSKENDITDFHIGSVI